MDYRAEILAAYERIEELKKTLTVAQTCLRSGYGDPHAAADMIDDVLDEHRVAA